MRRNTYLWTLALLLSGSGSAALAANNHDLSVIGSVIPSACEMSLTNLGKVDYGLITSEELIPGEYLDLGAKSSQLLVTCRTPTLFAIKAVSHRKGSVAGSVTENARGLGTMKRRGYNTDSFAGLGNSPKGDKIGGYALAAHQIQSDGDSAAAGSYSDDNGATWKSSSSYISMYNADGDIPRLIGGAMSNGAPVALSQLDATVQINAYLNKRELLDTSGAFNMDGMTTFELVYL